MTNRKARQVANAAQYQIYTVFTAQYSFVGRPTIPKTYRHLYKE